jgi:phosphatidylglycerophosphatase A
MGSSFTDLKTKHIPPLHIFFATGGYSGFSPIAPGTAGSLVGLLIYLIPGVNDNYFLIILSVLFFIVGIITSSKIEKAIGDDPGIIVIDEIVGMWVSLLFLPKKVPFYLGAFILFRLFDIIKPEPARKVEKIKKGWGIMLDDVVAGIYTNISLQFIHFIF